MFLRRWRSAPLPRFATRASTIVPVIILLMVILEEVYIGTMYIWHMNRYASVVYKDINVTRNASSPSIAIVVVLMDRSNEREYALANETLRCYSALHRYNLRFVDISANKTLSEICPMPDFMFRRHCVLRRILDEIPEDWVLFLDADIGIINPNHLIEEYLPTNQSKHIVFYDRIMNFEIMAGSYLIRNSEYSRRFLKYWADYYFALPDSFHGTDNGAIHNVVLEFALPYLHTEKAQCNKLWAKSKDFAGLYDYEVCVRLILNGRDLGGIEIRNKTHPQRWSRDGWLTENVWAPSDFMFHGWQKRRMDVMTFAQWHTPFALSPLDTLRGMRSATEHPTALPPIEEYCRRPETASRRWAYKDSFVESDRQVAARLQVTIADVERKFQDSVIRLKNNKDIK